MEPKIHQKPSKAGLWAAWGVRRHPLAGKGGPGGGYPPKKTLKSQKKHDPEQKNTAPKTETQTGGTRHGHTARHAVPKTA